MVLYLNAQMKMLEISLQHVLLWALEFNCYPCDMRYAICEDDDALEASCHGSLYHEQNNTGMRPVEEGFIYCIHTSDPEIIKAFSVQKDGTMTGSQLKKGDEKFRENGESALIFERNGTLKTLFVPIELTSRCASMLLSSNSDQSQLMNSLDLSSLDIEQGSKNFVPVKKLKQSIDFTAEIVQPKDEFDLGKYTWLDFDGLFSDRQGSITSSVQEKYVNDHGILLFDDICSDIKEIAEQRDRILAQYKKYCESDQDGYTRLERFEMAKVLEQLMSTDVHVRKMVAELIKDSNINIDDKAQVENFNELVSDYFHAVENRNNYKAEKHVNYNGRTIYISKNAKAESCSEKLERLYGIEIQKITSVARDNLNEYRNLVEGKKYGGSGMKDVIDKEAVDTFTQEWEDKKQWFAKHCEKYLPLLKYIAPKWHLLSAYLSPIDAHVIDMKLNYEDTLYSCLNHGDPDWINDYYFGESEFPLSVYSDLSSVSVDYLYKDIGAIFKKNLDLGEKLKGVEKFQEKIDKANKLKVLIDFGADEVRTRISESLMLKQESFAVALTNGLKTSGLDLNYQEKLANFFDNMSHSTRRYVHLNLELMNLSWNSPDGLSVRKLETLSNNVERAKSQFKVSLINYKKIKASYKKIRTQPKARRDVLRKQYNADLRKSKIQLNEAKSNLLQNVEEFKSNINASTAILTGASLSLADIEAEAAKVTRSGQTIDELFKKDGKYDSQKVWKHSVNSFLAIVYTYSAWQAWKSLLDEETDGDVLAVLSTTSFAAASYLGIANTVVAASLTARATEGSSRSLRALGMTSKWAVYTGTSAAILGFVAIGIRTWNAGVDVFDSYRSNRSDVQTYLAFSRAGLSFIGGVVAGIETYKYGQIAVLLYRARTGVGAIAITANVSFLSIAARYIRLNVALWAAFFVIDKIWQYYRWPDLVSWANQTLWGKNDQHWSMDEHYKELEPNLVIPSMTYSIEGNTYQSGQVGEAEAVVRFHLPNIASPDEKNTRIAIWAFSAGYLSTPAKWTNILPALKAESDITLIETGDCEITFYLRSDWLYDKRISQIKFQVEITSQHEETHYCYWDVRCERAYFGPDETPNVLCFNVIREPNWVSTVRSVLSISEEWGKLPEHPMTPWSE
ncbi:hypothetical protein VSF3289_01359 [Vibrio scophthalmi]|uniref:Toxin VasX N-terminal region domain-containing protein n=2 Tax=Vibrio scophthalmi TaxID=45658 RepID=A0A1E3WMU7_9VIBR|nr:hypothetical protein VSF3289_01359 [Vibrio scophthalmi]